MDNLNECLEYFKSFFNIKINDISDKIAAIDKGIKSDKSFYDDLQEKAYDLIDYNDYKSLFVIIFKDYKFDYAAKAREAASIIKMCEDMHIDALPQLIDAKKYFSLISEKLSENISNSIKIKNDLEEKLEIFKKYLPYFESKDTFLRLTDKEIFDLLSFVQNEEKNSSKSFSIIRDVIDLVRKRKTNESLNNLPSLTDEENREIEEFIKKKEELDSYYFGLSDKDRVSMNNISLILNSNNDEIVSSLSDSFSVNFIKLFTLLGKLKDEYKTYFELRDNIESDVGYISLLKEQIVLIRQLLDDIRKIKVDLPVDKTPAEDNKKICNLVIYLDDDGESFFVSDIDKLRSDNFSNHSILKMFLDELYHLNIYSYVKDASSKTIKPSRGVSDYSEEIKPYTIRKDNVVFAYSKIPVSKDMKDILINKYDLSSNFGVILIYGVKPLKDSSYTEFNQRFSKEIYNIRELFDTFSGNFDDTKIEFATSVIEDGFDIYDYISKKYGKGSR